jgi:hypothetical protein
MLTRTSLLRCVLMGISCTRVVALVTRTVAQASNSTSGTAVHLWSSAGPWVSGFTASGCCTFRQCNLLSSVQYLGVSRTEACAPTKANNGTAALPAANALKPL